MWVGIEVVLWCVVVVFGVVWFYYVYFFVNCCVNWMKVFVYDGIGVCGFVVLGVDWIVVLKCVEYVEWYYLFYWVVLDVE